ncbi:TetR/AcrR family transcriptional regulator [Gryllotalpicola protaetiae]|uniref:TetR/AcrR family transcriptional regulator n=1 Tax=Gryllotalpicola protaetiae TaxID=2419771 RepID=A0A387BJY3_9MICO|nr:TetR/AcrR family transcriptional regulator [Gryllotalpicola protaetiae]AYG04435.1 TetR/AcrR family transcriptional regulator [Gryllotalpicola protaetiae]
MTTTDASPEAAPARRAPAMSPEDRRAQIVDATIPLVLAAGAAVTSKQIAEAAGVAEGTVFRAFGDKDAVIDAAVAKYLDPAPLRVRLGAIDPTLPLEFKVRQVLSMLQERFQGVFAMMTAVGMRERPPVPRDTGDGYAQIIAELFAPDIERLGIAPDRIGPFLRALSFVTSIGPFQASGPIEIDELVDLALHGIVGDGAARQASATQASATPTETKEDRC